MAVDLYYLAQDALENYSFTREEKRWQLYLMSMKLRSLRVRRNWTQGDLAVNAKISEAAVRNYEQYKSLPKEDHLNAMAKALRVRPEALHLYDFSASSVQANAIFQLGETYGLKPASHEGFACLLPQNGFMEEFLRVWTEQYLMLKREVITKDEYEDWKDGYAADFDVDDFPKRYAHEGTREQIEPWTFLHFSQQLKRLRNAAGYTQAQLAALVNCTESAMRSYEQGKRLPKIAPLRTMARALNVTEGALTFYNFGSPIQTTHVLFQIANIYGLVPDVIDGQPMLRTVTPGIEQVLDNWASALAVLETSGDETGYQAWKDIYNPDDTRFEHITRYKPYFDNDGSLQGRCSNHDPFNEKYPDGFLRA